MLQYHIKRNQELHEVLKTYLTKFEDSGQGNFKQDTHALLSLLNPSAATSHQILDNCDTLN